MGAIIQFYQGIISSDSGYQYDDILTWDDNRLESRHDYIQWLFPLTEASRAVPNAPILMEEEITAFRESEALQRKLLAAWVRMLAFYGINLWDNGKEIQILPASNYYERINHLIAHPHNYLRITRILKSMRLLGLEDEATLFFTILGYIYRQQIPRISVETYGYWQRAMAE